jgi:hypothetical protein
MGELKLNISGANAVKELQDQFSSLFPFLRINFFKRGRVVDKVPAERVILFSQDVKLNDINPGMRDGDLEFSEATRVSELENMFNEKFGLSIQVLRKSGNLWLDTSRTKSWTLKEQNDHGREISTDQKGRNLLNSDSNYKQNLG